MVRLRIAAVAGACLLALGLNVGLADTAQAQALRKIYVRNACNRPLQLLIDHADAYHVWHARAWYKFAPNEGSYLNNAQGVALRQLEDHQVYAYAETIDQRPALHWQGAGPEVTWEGGSFRTIKLNSHVDTDGDIAVRLTCE